ncbi:MAG: hypothetical protein AAGE52_26550 [Myxococcota bacterium]
MGWDLSYHLDPPQTFGRIIDAALQHCDALGYPDVTTGFVPVGGGTRRMLWISIGVDRAKILETQAIGGELELALQDAEADDESLYVTLMAGGSARAADIFEAFQGHADNALLPEVVGLLSEAIAETIGAVLLP